MGKFSAKQKPSKFVHPLFSRMVVRLGFRRMGQGLLPFVIQSLTPFTQLKTKLQGMQYATKHAVFAAMQEARVAGCGVALFRPSPVPDLPTPVLQSCMQHIMQVRYMYPHARVCMYGSFVFCTPPPFVIATLKYGINTVPTPTVAITRA